MDQGVGHEVKRLREECGWSQAKLAVEADMSVSGVSMIENGQRNLTTTTLAKLASALGVEIADLFPKEQSRLPFEDGERRYQVNEEDLASLFRNLARRGQRIVRAVEQSLREGTAEELFREVSDYYTEAATLRRVKGGRDIRGKDPEELAEAVENCEEVEARLHSMITQDLYATPEERAERLRFKGDKGGDHTGERGANAS